MLNSLPQNIFCLLSFQRMGGDGGFVLVKDCGLTEVLYFSLWCHLLLSNIQRIPLSTTLSLHNLYRIVHYSVITYYYWWCFISKLVHFSVTAETTLPLEKWKYSEATKCTVYIKNILLLDFCKHSIAFLKLAHYQTNSLSLLLTVLHLFWISFSFCHSTRLSPCLHLSTSLSLQSQSHDFFTSLQLSQLASLT